MTEVGVSPAEEVHPIALGSRQSRRAPRVPTGGRCRGGSRMNDAGRAFDVAVVGAGPAGAAAALTLRRRDLSVVLLESRPAPAWQIGETLPPAARPLLQTLGILADFESDGHLPSYGNHSAWGGG